VHPHDVGLELIGDTGRVGIGAQHVATADIDLVGEHEGDRLAGDRCVKWPVEGVDPGDRAAFARWQRPDGVADVDRTADDLPGKPAEVEVGAVDPDVPHFSEAL
jgi:hypothetical protein